jgi:magnesium transporter
MLVARRLRCHRRRNENIITSKHFLVEPSLIFQAFGIHPLTTEDIVTLEPREKVELFRSYYLVSLRSFEQDPGSSAYLSPLSLYMIVFRSGILTFHSSPTPHPANVRRRIRQLKDYIQVSADWICYALIDDIVDGFAPLLDGVEQEVDAIDEGVLSLHREDEDEVETGEMLQHIGLARKKVMGLLRLLGSKADVIKGFSKRCNEKWEVAPRSEIGLYLGDIQGDTPIHSSDCRSHCNYGTKPEPLRKDSLSISL